MAENGRKRNEDELGALWEKQGDKGEYMTGEINGEKVICFRIDSQHPNAPQWRVLKARKRDERRTTTDW